MKRVIQFFVLSIFVFLITINDSFAQQWTSEQQDVWAGVEAYWEISSKGDAEGFLSYFDASYIGWAYQSKVPQNKANTSKWIKNDLKNNSTVLYTITPVSIWVKDDFAFVNYFYSQIEKNNKTGEEEPSSGKWTDILAKKGNKWVLIGDHGGRTSKKQ